jgi:hypothetical protein
MYANGCERPSSRTRSVAGAEEGSRAAKHGVHLDASDAASWENKSGRTYGALCSSRFCFAFTPAAAPAHVGNGSVSRRVQRRPRARCTVSSKEDIEHIRFLCSKMRTARVSAKKDEGEEARETDWRTGGHSG